MRSRVGLLLGGSMLSVLMPSCAYSCNGNPANHQMQKEIKMQKPGDFWEWTSKDQVMSTKNRQRKDREKEEEKTED